MRSRWIARVLAAAGLVALPLTVLPASPAAAVPPAFTGYAVEGPNLVRFTTANPATTTLIGPITGLAPGEQVEGIDFRPATGGLYALGVRDTPDPMNPDREGRLYQLSTNNAVATQVGSLFPLLPATFFGFDVSPAADLIRVVSNAKQNLRLNPVTAAVIPDTPLNPGEPFLVGSAYANNHKGAAATTLFGVDYNSDQLVRQGGVNGSPSPNTGMLTPIGPLGVDAFILGGFDIASPPSGDIGFVNMTRAPVHVDELFAIDLATGTATLLGPLGDSPHGVRAIAIQLQPGCTITGTGGSDFLTGTPGDDVICGLGGDDVLSGLGGDDLLLGGDGRDVLYGGAGNDQLSGEAGNDALYGQDGTDSLTGGAGADALYGNAGPDTLHTLDGVNGNDYADGGAGTDTCTTDPGDPKLSC